MDGWDQASRWIRHRSSRHYLPIRKRSPFPPILPKARDYKVYWKAAGFRSNVVVRDQVTTPVVGVIAGNSRSGCRGSFRSAAFCKPLPCPRPSRY